MTPKQLQKHIYKTYFALRLGLCVFGFVFPVLLLGIGWWKDIPLQVSMSAYYFAFAPPTSELRDFPGRVVYVGILFVVGFFLVLYRGFSKPENWALNIAGAMALVTALVPMQAPDYCTKCGSNTFSFVHDTAGVVLFVCLAFVACACTNSLRHLPDPIRRWFRVGYYVIAILMIAAPAAAIVMTVFFGIYDKKIFFVEWFAVWMFGAYWLLKSIELGISKAERNALMPNEPLEENSLRNGASRLLDRNPVPRSG